MCSSDLVLFISSFVVVVFVVLVFYSGKGKTLSNFFIYPESGMLLDFSHHHKLSIPSQSHGTRHLKGTSSPIKESLQIAGYNICNNASFNFFFSRRVSIVVKNEFQNRVFLFSNFPGATILNNCDVKWLPYCSDTKSSCLITKGQPFHVTIFQDGGTREI